MNTENDIRISSLQEAFRNASEYFTDHSYIYGDPDDDGTINSDEPMDTLMCSIHSYFDDSEHNCVACNLEDSNELVRTFLDGWKNFNDVNHSFTFFILTLYLSVTRMEEYLNIIELPKSIRETKFSPFSDIKKWANFIKHPKGFMFVHHPNYTFDGLADDMGDDANIIDFNFVKDYYSDGKKNRSLLGQLQNKENVWVNFPNPAELVTEFCICQEYFVSLIKNNEIVRELLTNNASVFYSDEAP